MGASRALPAGSNRGSPSACGRHRRGPRRRGRSRDILAIGRRGREMVDQAAASRRGGRCAIRARAGRAAGIWRPRGAVGLRGEESRCAKRATRTKRGSLQRSRGRPRGQLEDARPQAENRVAEAKIDVSKMQQTLVIIRRTLAPTIARARAFAANGTLKTLKLSAAINRELASLEVSVRQP